MEPGKIVNLCGTLKIVIDLAVGRLRCINFLVDKVAGFVFVKAAEPV